MDREDPHDQVHHKDRARHLTRSAGLEVKSRQADHPEAHTVEATAAHPEAEALAQACPDQAAGSLLAHGVHPKNAHQDATVVCPNHTSSTKFHELVGKAHREENEEGRSVFLRPSSKGAFQAW